MIERAIRHVVVVVCAVGFSLSAGQLSAQTVGASLQGVVTDQTGAPIPSADVIVIAIATGRTWEIKTDSAGLYRVPVLQPGDYEVHVSQTGFQPVARRGIQLTVGQNAVVDLKLEVGRVSEELTVTGAAPFINTTSGAVSGLVSDKEI